MGIALAVAEATKSCTGGTGIMAFGAIMAVFFSVLRIPATPLFQFIGAIMVVVGFVAWVGGKHFCS